MLRLSMSGLPIKIIKFNNIRVTDVVFKPEDLWNGWIKKDGVNANLVVCGWPNLDTHSDFAFSPRLRRE